MFFSSEQIEQSIKRLNDLNPFFGITFLAFKQAKLPIGTTVSINSTQILDTFLRQYYHPVEDFAGYYTPFRTWNNKKKRWNSHLYANTLHVNAAQRFSDVLMHPGGSQWGWQTNYVNVIRTKYLKTNLIPAFDLAVWLFYLRQWQHEVADTEVIETFFAEFVINGEERALFDVSPSPLATPRFRNQSISHETLLNIISPPPNRITEGALLETLKLTGIGPAEQLDLKLAPRLNLITGDNGLGKTFLLECAWWALTGDWIGYPARPRQSAEVPSIAYQIHKNGHAEKMQTVKYNWDQLTWEIQPKRNTLPGLSILAQIDGSFAVWDPAKYILARDEHYAGRTADALTRFSRTTILHGKNEPDQYGRTQRTSGLINDWIRWQEAADQTRFEELSAALYALSPHPEQEPLIPGQPIRMPELIDSRDIPTLAFPYGDVPIIHCSAGIQRIISLIYILIWAWQEHLKTAEGMRRRPVQSIVLFIDEMEAHLHPLWQRTILPALMSSVQELVSEVQIQIVVATHSPLVLASAEPLFDHTQDKLFHLYLEGKQVRLDDMPFVRRGRVDKWLMSEIFGLKNPRSKEAEEAIEYAKTLQIKREPTQEEVQQASNQLSDVLAQDDDFWPRWTYFAEKRGIEL